MLQCVAVLTPPVICVLFKSASGSSVVLQCVAVCCSVFAVGTTCDMLARKKILERYSYGAVCCSVLQCVAVCCSGCHLFYACSSRLPRPILLCCSVLPCVAVHTTRDMFAQQICLGRYPCVAVYCVAVCCSVLQCVAVHTACDKRGRQVCLGR